MFKKYFSSFLLCAAATAVLIPGMALNADSQVEINETNFPDEIFRNYVSENIDENKDGKLSSDDRIENIIGLIIDKDGIKDLKGIEYLTNLRKLEYKDNELTKIDLSKNTELNSLDIENNKVDKLDLSKNTKLVNLNCKGNLLEKLDLSRNTKLTYLQISDNKLDKLDLSKNTKIENLFVDNNCLTRLKLSSKPELVQLECTNNAIKSLDLSHCPCLIALCCQGNQIDRLDISGCEGLLKALEGDKEEKDGYVIYTNGNLYELSFDVKTIIKKDAQFTIDDNTKHVFLDQGAVVPLGFEGANDQTKVVLTSSDDSIVKIGDNNTLVTLKAGSSDITAKVGDKEYKFKVTVYYKDVKDNYKFWFEPTYALTEKGVVKGYDNQTKFKPANKCTRAQMVTFIWRLAGSPEPETKECKFSDVKKSDYFYKACLWGNEKGIVEGYKDGTFGPQIVCARRHAVTFLWRFAGKPEPNVDKIKFTDVFKDISEDDYFYEACLWASEKKIVAGYSDNTFRPNGDCLRRQMVTFLYKYDKFVNAKK